MEEDTTHKQDHSDTMNDDEKKAGSTNKPDSGDNRTEK